MTQYPILHYSKREVVRVGDTLRGKIAENCTEEILQAFRIAYDWRNSHAYPMKRIRQELGGRVRRIRADAVTAGRMKRMSSIRRKLARLPGNLTQIHDLGGCRAIVQSIDDTQKLIEYYKRGESVHEFRNDYNYIDNPKVDGYRSYHAVLSYRGEGEETKFDGRRIEVKIRTQLQHAWATSVEAVGLFRGQDLKAGEGDANWLRLFTLMSAEFADIEKCQSIPGTPRNGLRRKELRDLNNAISAIDVLESLSQSFKAASSFRTNAKYFVLGYDKAEGIVTVRTLEGAVWAEGQARDDWSRDDVMVEVDKVDNLRAAYPNYFGDVRSFLSHLKRVVNGYDTSWVAAYGGRKGI